MNTWNPMQFFDMSIQPPFRLCPTEPQLTKAVQDLQALSFDVGLRVIVASQPKFEHKEWLKFQTVLAQSAIVEDYLHEWLSIAKIMRTLLPDVQRFLYSQEKTSLKSFLQEVCSKANELDQFALFACFYAYALDSIQARIQLACLIQHFGYPQLELQKIRAFYLNLPNRRKAVVQLAAFGYTNAEIAKELFISEMVVSEHLTKAYLNFGGYLSLPADTYGRRYRLIHYLSRLFEREPNLILG